MPLFPSSLPSISLLPSSLSRHLLGGENPNLRATLRAFNLNVGLRMTYEAACGAGALILTAYALSLGINEKDMGYLPAAMYLAAAMQMVCLFLLPKIKDAKGFAIKMGAVEPLLIITLVALMPLVWTSARLTLFIVMLLIATSTMQITRPIIDNWVAQRVPERVRPKYLARRTQIVAALQIIAVMSFAFLADKLGKTDPIVMGGLVVLGAALGLMSVLALQGAAMPKTESTAPTLRDLAIVLTHKPYMRVMIVSLGFNFPFYFAAPYYQTFNLKVLDMSVSMAGSLTVLYAVSKFVSLFVSHIAIKKLGSRWMLLCMTPVYTAFFVMFMFCTPDRYWPLLIAWFVVGACDGAYGVIIFTELFKAVPKEGPRTMFFAVFNIASVVLFGIIAAMVPHFLGFLETGLPALLSKLGITLQVAPGGALYMLYALAAILMLPCGMSALAMSKK